MSHTFQTLLVTGGCGFIGSNFVRYILEHTQDIKVVNLDKLTYAGNLENLKDLESDERYTFIKADICDREIISSVLAENKIDAIAHLAAESHVDRSIIDSTPFIQTNVLGTQVLIDTAREAGVTRFLHVSTDEVYGSLPLDQPKIKFTESTPIKPNSPYAASKAASDLLIHAAHETFGLNTVITRCSNNFGPYQFPEKVIPLFISNLMEGKPLPLYGDGLNVRDWIHVMDHCEALWCVMKDGGSGEVYNIGAINERSNLELTHSLLQIMGHDERMITPVKDRLGHDRRYAIDNTKIETELGWHPSRSQWPHALSETVKWYQENEAWWRGIKSGEYLDYYERQYGDHR